MAWYESFRGKVVLVTGASSGIGHATALAFAHAGARVALLARRRELLDDAVARATAAGGEAIALAVDVTDRSAVQAAVAAVVERWGRLDVVVNNAGILLPSPVAAIDPADLDRMLRVNLFGALHVTQAALPFMRARGEGSLVTVASLAGRRGVPDLGGYCATKFALVGLTETLRTELRGEPIHVSLVLPGVVETPMVEGLSHDSEFLAFWPSELNMPVSWVVWAVFAAARFHLAEVSVPPGAATLEKLGALAPGVADAVVEWARALSGWVAHRLHDRD